jgi:hypothetical protein
VVWTFDDAIAAGMAALQQVAGRNVVYRRGNDEVQLNAVLGQTEYETTDEYGLTVGTHIVDFLILAADLTLGDPQPGDRIVVDDVAYEVEPIASEGHWRWSDPRRTIMRIHAKQVGVDEDGT